MSKGILNSYSDIAFVNIIKNSDSYKDCARKLGYKTCTGDITKLIKKRVRDLNIDVSHFCNKATKKRSTETVFCKDSTVDSTTLRRWYLRGNYTPYVCAICGQEPFWNGKEMSLILDHINGKNKDNRLGNLRWACPNCNIQLETSNGKNQARKERKLYYCCDCGIELKYKKSIRCPKCNYEHIKKQHMVDENGEVYSFPNANKLVHKKELKQLIRIKSFVEIGEYYGVTDNAVRKWCKTMHLPNKVSEIKKIPDNDWNRL